MADGLQAVQTKRNTLTDRFVRRAFISCNRCECHNGVRNGYRYRTPMSAGIGQIAAQIRKIDRLALGRRLLKILGDRENVCVVGDRFIFQAEVLFDSGSAETNPTGRAQISKLAEALAVLQNEIPDEVNWVLRVDGHTDIKPIRNARFPSNWELSSARAISVVRQLLDAGVPPRRLVAAGFGEFQPLDAGEDPESLRRNRRIELKLTEK